MKKITYILIAFIAFCMSGCENDPDIHKFPSADVDFKYSIEGDYAIDYIIGSEIKFENISRITGTAAWDFGDGVKSDDPQPTHRYDKPGNYEIKLTVGDKMTKKNILVSDMKNLVSYSASETPSIINSSVIELDITLPNPGDYPATFKWTFPDGTMDESGNLVTTSTEHNPGKLRFKNVGSQQLLLETTIMTAEGPRKLDNEQVNVQIGYNQDAKTIYFACKDGYMRALKIINNLPSDVKNTHFNLKASSGQHPFNIFFHDTLLYVLDAGKQFYFVDDQSKNLGDGRISVISRDGEQVESMASNVGEYAFDDPFYGYIDKSSKTLYFTDRNTGIRRISLDARNQTISTIPFWVQNATLNYYNVSWVYGCGNSTIAKVGNTWWWGKYFNSMGLYRFAESDILPAPVTTGDGSKLPAAGIALPNNIVKSFVVDSKNSILYAAITSPADRNGFYAIELSQLEGITAAQLATKRVAVLPPDSEGTDAEKIFISQMVIDEEDGSVYFGYRAGEGATEKTGLKRYNPLTKKLETLVENIEIYGVAINDTKSKLF